MGCYVAKFNARASIKAIDFPAPSWRQVPNASRVGWRARIREAFGVRRIPPLWLAECLPHNQGRLL